MFSANSENLSFGVDIQGMIHQSLRTGYVLSQMKCGICVILKFTNPEKHANHV